MRGAHLHARGGDTPFGGGEVQLAPFRFAQFPGPHKQERCQLQGRLGDRLSAIVMQRAQQWRDLRRIDDRGVVLHAHRSQGPAQVRTRIALRAPGGDRIAKHLPAALLGAMRGLVFATRLQAPTHG